MCCSFATDPVFRAFLTELVEHEICSGSALHRIPETFRLSTSPYPSLWGLTPGERKTQLSQSVRRLRDNNSCEWILRRVIQVNYGLAKTPEHMSVCLKLVSKQKSVAVKYQIWIHDYANPATS